MSDIEELVEAAKRAMKIISVGGEHNEFVFYLRDLIRKFEEKNKKEEPEYRKMDFK